MTSSRKSYKSVVVVDDRRYHEPSVKSIYSMSSRGATYSGSGSGSGSDSNRSSRDSSADRRVYHDSHRSSKSEGFTHDSTTRWNGHKYVQVHNQEAATYSDADPHPTYQASSGSRKHY